MDKMALGKVDRELIRELAEILKETDLTEIEYEVGGAKVRVARSVVQSVIAAPQSVATVSNHASVSNTSAPSDLKSHPGALKSPMVGTVYLAPEPGAPAFVRIGDTVSVGQNLLIIEAMKVMNPIKATNSGIVKQILVRDGEPVEFDTPLLIIE
jgi:acetyl-CoA carboxylase biotin carboxyl carrier protein